MGNMQSGGANFLPLSGGEMSGNITFAGAETVDGVDISAIHQAKIITGTYTGDGNDNRDINIGIDLASKTNVYVIIKGESTVTAKHRIEYAQGDNTMMFNNVADLADTIQSFTNTGFQIGTTSGVNTNGMVYRYIVFYQE